MINQCNILIEQIQKEEKLPNPSQSFIKKDWLVYATVLESLLKKTPTIISNFSNIPLKLHWVWTSNISSPSILSKQDMVIMARNIDLINSGGLEWKYFLWTNVQQAFEDTDSVFYHRLIEKGLVLRNIEDLKILPQGAIKELNKFTPAVQVDTYEYCLMAQEGGLSLDTDFWLEKDVTSLLFSSNEVILGTWGLTAITNGLYASQRGHMLFRDACLHSYRNFLRINEAPTYIKGLIECPTPHIAQLTGFSASIYYKKHVESGALNNKNSIVFSPGILWDPCKPWGTREGDDCRYINNKNSIIGNDVTEERWRSDIKRSAIDKTYQYKFRYFSIYKEWTDNLAIWKKKGVDNNKYSDNIISFDLSSKILIPYTLHWIWITSPSKCMNIRLKNLNLMTNAAKKLQTNSKNTWKFFLWTNVNEICIIESVKFLNEKIKNFEIKFLSDLPYHSVEVGKARNYVLKFDKPQYFAGMASDLYRWIILYYYGGLYVDVDTVIYKSFDGLMQKYNTIVAASGGREIEAIGNTPIASIKGNQLVDKLISSLASNIMNFNRDSYLNSCDSLECIAVRSTGGYALTSTYYTFGNLKKDIILPYGVIVEHRCDSITQEFSQCIRNHEVFNRISNDILDGSWTEEKKLQNTDGLEKDITDKLSDDAKCTIAKLYLDKSFIRYNSSNAKLLLQGLIDYENSHCSGVLDTFILSMTRPKQEFSSVLESVNETYFKMTKVILNDCMASKHTVFSQTQSFYGHKFCSDSIKILEEFSSDEAPGVLAEVYRSGTYNNNQVLVPDEIKAYEYFMQIESEVMDISIETIINVDL